jgi:undecaprenyl-diphosphatase
MTAVQALVLGLVQGVTEFLPISSTAHLRILPHFMGWPDSGAAFSAVIQLGTLVAVFVYFAADIQRLATAALASLRLRRLDYSPDARLAWSILPGTFPIALAALMYAYEDIFGPATLAPTQAQKM